jgi:peptidoglycan/xylan/chitin deacetylase (PgdA/CDA1 family)
MIENLEGFYNKPLSLFNDRKKIKKVTNTVNTKTGATIPLKKRLKIILGDIFYAKRRLILSDIRGLRVLLYHSVTDQLIEHEWEENTIPVDLFESQMNYLAVNKYNVISCREATKYFTEQREVPPRTVVITFDDGYRNTYLNALPILNKYNFCATMFINVSFLQDYSNNSEYLSCFELKHIKKSGIIDFGSHGLTHRILSTLSGKDLIKELRESKDTIEDIINDKVCFFAYPFGHSRSYNKKVIELIKSLGFIGAFTTIYGINNLKTNLFLMKRNRISWLDDLLEFEKHLIGAYDWAGKCEYFRYKRLQ